MINTVLQATESWLHLIDSTVLAQMHLQTQGKQMSNKQGCIPIKSCSVKSELPIIFAGHKILIFFLTLQNIKSILMRHAKPGGYGLPIPNEGMRQCHVQHPTQRRHSSEPSSTGLVIPESRCSLPRPKPPKYSCRARVSPPSCLFSHRPSLFSG